MKRNGLQVVIEFVFKYIWVFCLLLITLELGSTAYTAAILMNESADGVMESVSGEISGRVSNVMNLLNSLSQDERINDINQPLYKRASLTEPYRSNYNLYMIALTDEKVNVVSSEEKEAPKTNTSLAHRDYMQKLYLTGEPQITDAFLAGADGVTKQYTMAVPIKKGNQVKGSVFGSIYFEEVDEILKRDTYKNNQHFYMLGQENIIMSGDNNQEFGKTFVEYHGNDTIFGSDIKTIDNNIKNHQSGSYWKFDGSLKMVLYKNIEPTNWTLIYEVNYLSVLTVLLPVWFIKSIIYIIICLVMVTMGKKYFNKRLKEVNHLLDKMSKMQKEFFLSKQQTSYDDLLELTSSGLVDQLTGLLTRTVLMNKLSNDFFDKNSVGSILFIDLDNLKQLNDHHGHEFGDAALIYVSKILKEYEDKYQGVASRYGGDEFVLALPNIDKNNSEIIGEEICHNLTSTIELKGIHIDIHASIGIALYPLHGLTSDELICKADLALYISKQNGKNCSTLYTDVEGGDPKL